MRWLVLFFVLLILLGGLRPWLRKVGLGRLPGDFTWHLLGREIYLPLATSLLLSFLVNWAVHWF